MRCKLSVLIVATTVLLPACRADQDMTERRDLEIYAAVESDSAHIAQLGGKQHDLLRALADHTADPTPLMTRDFVLIDYTDTVAVNQRAPDGRPTPGRDFFKTLASRMPSEYSVIGTMEAVYDRPNSAVVYVRHPAGARSITHWKFSEGSWKANIVILNVEESAFTESRNRRMTGS